MNATLDDILYPPIEPHATGLLDVDEGHSLYWESCGAEDGVPVILLHGGPGAPSRPLLRRFFDPGFYRYITFHQRGCGLSTPLAELRGNDTWASVADIERLREHLAIDRWLVAGGSWGSALALAYGQAHPARALGFSLIGVTLCRPEDTDWWWNGTRRLFPDAFDAMLDALPPAVRDDPMHGLHRLLVDPDPAVHAPAARALALFSAATVTLTPNPETLALYEDPAVTVPLARFFVHYSVNGFFLAPGQLLADVGRIRHLACRMVVGRYDVTTPPASAWALHRAWPGSTLTILGEGAHGLSDPAVASAFLASHEAFKAELAPATEPAA